MFYQDIGSHGDLTHVGLTLDSWFLMRISLAIGFFHEEVIGSCDPSPWVGGFISPHYGILWISYNRLMNIYEWHMFKLIKCILGINSDFELWIVDRTLNALEIGFGNG